MRCIIVLAFVKLTVIKTRLDRIYGMVGFLIAVVAAAPVSAQKGDTTVKARTAVSEYVVQVVDLNVPRLSITARLPIDGSIIQMDETRPGDLPQILDNGWPSLVRNLRVADAGGRELEITNNGPGGWQLKKPFKGTINVKYEVDYSLPAKNSWPAPRETGFRDDCHFVFVGRSAFVTTQQVVTSRVRFVLPRNWAAVAPWTTAAKGAFAVSTKNDLTENMIVLTRGAVARISVSDFNIAIISLGHWRPMQTEIAAVLRRVVPQFVRMFPMSRSENYSVVLLPVNDSGGESYRASFAYSLSEKPSSANRAVWARTIGHEIFHYWNGWRLRGEDYASTQWFQEGFTDYAADIAMVASGVLTRDDLRHRLSEHIANYGKLSTPLAEPGTRKGPPLYSGGALVAFCWDVLIRSETSGRRGLPDVFRSLWRQTGSASRPYRWEDIRTALSLTAGLEWEDFYQRHIRSREKLPLESTFSSAGLILRRRTDDSQSVETDPGADANARAVWTLLVQGR